MPDDELPLYIEFPEGEGPEVVTGVFCHLFGGCESCPGILTAAQANLTGRDPAERVFCVHWCHLDAREA